MKNYLLILSFLLFLVTNIGLAQQNVFNRDNSNTGDWGSGNLPWSYQTSNNNQGDPDNGNNTRNDVFIGHNTFTSMILNGRFYIHRDFTFQAGASTQRTISFSGNGGFSFTRSFINASTANHQFNAPFAIDATGAEIKLTNGSGGGLTFNGSVFTNNNQTFIRYDNGNTGTIAFTGAMTQGGTFVKQGGGTLTFSGSADFSGSVFIDEGTLRVARNFSNNQIDIGGGIQLTTGLNAILEVSNGGIIVSKAVNVRNFGSGSGNRIINFTHPSSTTATISGAVALEKIVEINNPSTNDGALLTGIISGGGGINKTGAGLLTLTAANTYTGLTTINAGTLRLNRTGGGTLPPTNNVTCAGGTLRVSSNQTLNELSVPEGSTLIVDAGVTLTIDGTFSGAGTINNNGTIAFTGANNGVAINAGTVAYTGSVPQTVAAGTYNNLTITNSAIKTLGGNVTVGGVATLNSGTITAIGTNTLTLNGTLTGEGALRGGATSNLTIGGTGAFGSLRMDQTARDVTDVLNNFTINRTDGGSINLANNLLIVRGTLTLTAGNFNVGSNNLWLYGPYVAGNINNIKTTSGSNIDFRFTGEGPFILPNFDEMRLLSIGSPGQVYQLASSPTFFEGIYLGSGFLSIGANTITLNNGNFGVAGGRLRGGPNSNLIITGSLPLSPGNLVMDQTTPGTTNVLQNLTMNRASQTLTLNNALRLEGTLTPSAGTIASGGNLTLVSNASGTSRVAAGPTNNYITGNVTVERFVPNPNNGTEVFRKWRLLALPTNAASIRAAWADGRAPISADEGDKDGEVGYAGSGTLITGHQRTSAGSGYDWWPALGGVSSSSIRFYTPNSGGGNWSSATNTPDVTAAPDKPGYMLFVRGDRTNTLITSNSFSTTLRPIGSLKMGTQSVAIPDPAENKYEVLGNPYASAINFAAMRSSNATLIENQYWMWDPTLNNAGGYRLVKQVASQWRAIPSPFGDGAPADAFTPSIESGQAVLVQPLAAGNLSILESHKIANPDPANTIRPFSEPEGNAGLLMANLYRVNAETEKQLIDGTVASFSPNNSEALTDADDVQRAGNFSSALALAISRGNIALTVEGRPMVSSTDTLQLWLPGAVAKTNYELALFAGASIVPGGKMVLRDRFTNTETELLPGSVTRYAFAPTSDLASTNSLRFQIVLKAGSVLPVSITSITAKEQQGNIAVEWAVASETGVKQYEVQHSTTGANFAKAGVVKALNNGAATYSFVHQQPGSGQHFYRLRSEDADGTTQLSQVVKVNIGSNQKGFSVYPTLVSGNSLTVELTGLNKGRYTLQLNDMAGKMLMNTTIQYDGGSVAQNLQLPAGLAAGAYLIRLQGEGSSLTQKIVKE